MLSYSASKVVSRLLSVLVLSGMLFGFVDSSRPTIWAQEADEGKIAYVGQDRNIWLVNADGSDPTNLTNHPGSDNSPAWSPDSMHIAFVSYRDGNYEIYVMNADGSDQTNLTNHPGSDDSPAWSPDGAYIAFDSNRDGNSEIYVMRADGSGVTRLTNSLAAASCCPAWSPNGLHIAFVSIGGDLGYETAEIYVMNVDGSEAINLTPDAGQVYDPTWSPDSTRIAFWSIIDGIYVMNADGSGVTRLTNDYASDQQPAWSPDGTRIAFVSCPDHICNIYLMNADASGVIRLTDNTADHPDLGSPAWGPAVGGSQPDLGFRPNPNGYHFQNDQFLRSEEMFEQFFGTENVRHPDGSWCEAAKQFFRGTHPDMPQSWKGKGYRNVADGWSCLGFSLSSLLSYLDQPQPQAGPFAIAHYEQLYRHTEPDQFTDSIAYYSGVQTGKQYVDAFRARRDHCDTDPNRKIDDIEEGILNREPVIVLLNTFTEDGYHALVPYRVESVSSTETNIYVYDSEAPGEEHVIHFAHSGDEWHWTYTFVGSIAKAGTATGQCEDIFLYSIATSVEQGDPPVVFCESRGATSGVKALHSPDRSHRVLAQLPAEGDWVMRDNLGRRLGWVNGVLVSEIPDAFYVPQALGDVSLSYRILYLPEGGYTVELTDSPTNEFGCTLFGDGRFIEVAGHLRSPGSGVGLSITPGLDQARLSETQNLTAFTLTLDSERTAESRVAIVAGASLTGSGDLSVAFDGDQLMVSRGGGSLHYSPGLEKSDGQHFASELLTLEGNETHTVSPVDWSELGSANVVWEIDDDSDGTIDETLVLEDRANVPVPTPTATVSPENGKGKGPCPGSLAMIGLVGLATLIGLTRQSPQSWRRR
jgi:TolB protein